MALAATLVMTATILARGQGVCSGISQASDSPLTTVRVASGLTRPLLVVAPPDDTQRVFIVEQDGTIRIWTYGAPLITFLDVSALTRSPADGGGDEQGLLGLAFHPGYASNGWFFIYHTDTAGSNNHVARYTRSTSNPDAADTATRQVVLTMPHPSNANHNGGMMAFGPDDGYLYLGTGDGGSSCDPSGNAQNTSSNLGKLLRINVNSLPYTSPPDNPFVGRTGNDEIWALGLRNPWRFSFDRANSDLYIGDVGQGAWEEVDYRASAGIGGDNYGWDKYEGQHCPNPSCGSADCVVSSYVGPVAEYSHSGGGCSITGGYVYRGCRMPNLAGTYFYADYCAAFIKSFRIVDEAVTNSIDRTAELAPGGGLAISSITSFGEDGRGEIFIVERGGEVFKIVPMLRNLEVSGRGAQLFLLGQSSWTWEDLAAMSSQPITNYKIYRSTGNGSGVFDCIHQGLATMWAGGDLAVPNAGQTFSYLVTAVNAAGAQTSPGTSTSGVPRTLSLLACL